MLVLDSNHLSELERKSANGAALRLRLAQSTEPMATTIVCIEEQMRGWLSQIARCPNPLAQVADYDRLQILLTSYSRLTVLPFDAAAAAKFGELRQQHKRTGTMDLKIASIVLVNNAKLLTRNLKDFRSITGLVAEDWL